MPETIFKQREFLSLVKKTVFNNGYCVVVVSEGLKNSKGVFLSESNTTDAFGHAQLGGVAPFISELINNKLKLKNHWAVSDYLQRSASHIASKVDLAHAEAVGAHAVKYALSDMNGVMPIIIRVKSSKYKWTIEPAPLSKIANLEKSYLNHLLQKTNGRNLKSNRLSKPAYSGRI